MSKWRSRRTIGERPRNHTAGKGLRLRSRPPPHGARGRFLPALGAWCLLFVVLVAAAPAQAATFSAKLDRDRVSVGESVTLSLVVAGGSPQSQPAISPLPGFQVDFAGQSSQFAFDNGQVSSSLTFSYVLTAAQPGTYTIPSISVVVAGRPLATQPLKLTVVPQNTPAARASGGPFLQLILPRNQVYLGEVIPVEIRLYATEGKIAQHPQLVGDSFTIGKLLDPVQSRTQVGTFPYNLLLYKVAVSPAKAGSLTLGPATMVLNVPKPNARRNFFGEIVDWDRLTLPSEPATLQVLPVPALNVPASFSGAVGRYTLAVSASPTNLTVGDPVTVRIQVRGRGALDGLTLPSQDTWREFTSYPPTSKVETTDPLGIEGLKTFELVVSPQNAGVKELPPFQFSYFDPDQKTYRTLAGPPIPLIVRPSATTTPPASVVTGDDSSRPPPPATDIVHIKPRLGTIVGVSPALVQQAWFWAWQTVPVLAWLAALVWRKRSDFLANHPRVRRQREVARIVAHGLKELSRQAAANQSDEFFHTVFRLVQEQLGERLDLPAYAITEAIIEGQLRPRGIPEETLSVLHELFQACNQARYAPIKSSGELAAFIPKVQSTLTALQKLKL